MPFSSTSGNFFDTHNSVSKLKFDDLEEFYWNFQPLKFSFTLRIILCRAFYLRFVHSILQHILKRNPSHEEISKTLLRIFQTSDTTKEISDGSLSQELPIEGKSKSCTLVIENVDGGDETDGSVPDNIIEEEYPGETEILEDDTAEFIETSSDHGFNSKVEIIETWRDYPWTCTDCSSVFPGVLELREHIQKEHDSNECTYVCADCSKTYTKYYLFFNHVMTHRSHLRVYCDLCSDFCEQSVILAKHREEHKNEDNVALCSICAKAFKNTVSLYSHLRSHKVGIEGIDLCFNSFAE